MIRRATDDDVQAIAEIYNHYVRTSVATFDTRERSLEDRLEWLHSHDAEHPVLVAENDGRIIAWGSLSPWASRGAYRQSVEVSVYVAPDAVRQGIGPQLLDELVRTAEKLGHHAVLSQITSENASSLKMIERAGFRRVGVIEEVGWKFDHWLDVVLHELVLAPGSRPGAGGASDAGDAVGAKGCSA
ncbi:MAG: GNAT family N-acetyltransferase [Coriobacteriia bacterium]